MCHSVGTGVWLVTEMLPVAAVTSRISVPLRECHAEGVLSEVGCKGGIRHRDWIHVPLEAALRTLNLLQ